MFGHHSPPEQFPMLELTGSCWVQCCPATARCGEGHSAAGMFCCHRPQGQRLLSAGDWHCWIRSCGLRPRRPLPPPHWSLGGAPGPETGRGAQWAPGCVADGCPAPVPQLCPHLLAVLVQLQLQSCASLPSIHGAVFHRRLVGHLQQGRVGAGLAPSS